MDDFLTALADSRIKAPQLWAELRPYRFEDQCHLIRIHHRFVTWGVCELLCEESLRLTVVDAGRAVEMAELAVLISDQLREERSNCAPRLRGLYQLRAYAWAHDGNARRVLGDLRSAEESFSIADSWWEAGAAGAGDILGYEAAVVDLKASLRIAQRRFAEAFSLLDRLVAYHTDAGRPEHLDSHLAGRALVKKALALVEMEQPDLANRLLKEAESMVDPRRDSRLYLCLRHNFLWNLTSAEEYLEARALLPEVEALSRELGNPLDLIRLRWAEGRIAAGLGRTEAAVQIFEAVRQEFAERGMAYDAALVTLDLTAVHAGEGRLAEVKKLSLAMAKIFRAQDVPREALAALLFFQKAAERESATAKLAREIAAFLAKLRGEPDLRFERMS
jgi:tetratricopeptide (TPR) repeat protein